MNGKQARASRRAARQAQAAEILWGAVQKPGVILIVVDDARDEDVVRIIDYSDVDTAGRGGRVLFDDTGAAN